MTLSAKLLLGILAIVLFLIAAILGFGAFNSSADLASILGLTDLGLAAFVAAVVLP